MKKCKKRFVYVMLAVVLTALQLSGPVSALAAESKTLIKVSDIGDAALYALLAKAADPKGVNNGNLYKEDAQNITSINFSSGYGGKVREIQSFANFAKYCPNLNTLYTFNYESKTAKLSLAQEIAKMQNLKKLQFVFYAQEDGSCPELSAICSKSNKEKMDYFSVELKSGNFDLKPVSGLTGLTQLKIIIDSDAQAAPSQVVGEITGLKSLEVSSYQQNASEFQKIADVLPATVESLKAEQSAKVEGSISMDISGLTGLKEISIRGIDTLKGLYDLPALTSIDVVGSSAKQMSVDLDRLPAKLTRLRLEYCKIAGNQVSGIPDTMEELIIKNSGITKVEDLSHCKDLYYISFDGNELTSVPDISGLDLTYFYANDNRISDISKMKDCKSIYDLEMKNNQITDISALKNICLDKKVILSHNRITDVTGLCGQTQAEEVDLSYNRIQTLPDLTALTNLAGETYAGKYSSFDANGKYRLSFKGNKLTKAALQGKVPQDCLNDKYWVYASTMKATADGTAYFEEINTDILTALFNQYYRQIIYTTQQSMTLEQDVIDLMKSKNAQLEMYYIYNGNQMDKVTVKASSLPSDLTKLPIAFQKVVTGTSNREIEAAFSKYGKSSFYYEVPQERTTADISGVTYSAQVSMDVLDENKIYHEYIYNKESQTFYFYRTYKDTTTVQSNEFSSGLGDYYFVVEDSKDTLMDTDVYDKTGSDGQVTQDYQTYYRQVDDDIIRGWLLDDGNHTYGYGHYINADSISFSAQTAELLSENDAFYNVYQYNPDTHSSSSSMTLMCGFFDHESYTIPFPKVTTTTKASELSINFTGGTPERIYKLSEKLPDIYGVIYYINVPGFKRYAKNVYTCYEESPVMLSGADTSERIELPYNAELEYFTIEPQKDHLNKTVTTEAGKTLTYLANTDSSILRRMIQFSLTHQDTRQQNNVSKIFNVIDSNITLDEETVRLMKNTDISTRVMFRFYSLKNGKLQSELRIDNNRISDTTKSICLEKPQVEFSTSNAQFEALLPSGLSPVYVTNKAYMAKEVQYYYCDPDVVNEFFTNDKYDVLGISAANSIYTQESSANVTNRLRLVNSTGAVVLSSAYAEAKKNETTKPATQPTTAATKPAQTTAAATQPAQTTTAATKPAQTTAAATQPTTAATKPTQTTTAATKPAQTTTAATKPAQTTAAATQPTQPTTEATQPTQPTTEATKPTQATTEATQPTQAPTENTTDAPHMETGSDGKKYWYENGVKQGTEGVGKEIYDPATDAWYWLDAVQGGAVATDKDVNIPDGTPNGKWVRYDSEGRMVKGEDYRYGGWYYFDEITGAMIKGAYTDKAGTPCYYDEITGIGIDCSFKEQDGKRYWYEGGKRQGLEGRGKEIYSESDDAWYWLDAVQGGTAAVSKDVYQESFAGAFADREDGTGKWVRYDANGHMVKGWNEQNGNIYYFDWQTGAMAKGTVVIDGQVYNFDWQYGILQY